MPRLFVAGCNTCVYVENLVAPETSADTETPAEWRHDPKLDSLLKEAVSAVARDDD